MQRDAIMPGGGRRKGRRGWHHTLRRRQCERRMCRRPDIGLSKTDCSRHTDANEESASASASGDAEDLAGRVAAQRGGGRMTCSRTPAMAVEMGPSRGGGRLSRSGRNGAHWRCSTRGRGWTHGRGVCTPSTSMVHALRIKNRPSYNWMKKRKAGEIARALAREGGDGGGDGGHGGGAERMCAHCVTTLLGPSLVWGRRQGECY